MINESATEEPTEQSELHTHDYVAARLKQLKREGKVDVAKLPKLAHSVAEVAFFVGPMKYHEHKQWRDVRRFEDLQHAAANKTEEDPIERTKSDTLLLANSVFTLDGKSVGKDMAKDLLELEGAGPDNFRLIQLAEKANPPRTQLATEVAQMMNKSSVDLVMWRLLIEGGLIKVLIDYMSTHSTPEEREWAERELVKVEEVVYAFQPLFSAEDTAKVLGITFRSAMRIVAEQGVDTDLQVQS